MKFIHEYRNKEDALKLVQLINKVTKHSWSIMEVCGGQTHAIVRFGIDQLLPNSIQIIHGPGCPVCVTPSQVIDQAIALSQLPNVVLCTFGDMIRVPGSRESLAKTKARGANVRIVYSPMDALQLAKQTPDKEIVFLAVGFETTAPANAMAVYQAKKENIKNFSVLVSHVLVPPAIVTLLNNPKTRINGFLAAGHVCTIMGYEEYESIATQYRVPIVVTGFEPIDILQGIYFCIRQLENNEFRVENQYIRSVQRKGNSTAQNLMKEVFQVSQKEWRGLGEIPKSGLELSETYQYFDATSKFSLPRQETIDSQSCLSGEILQGLLKPFDCPAFGKKCTPENPLGPTMVSNEGACAAYYHFRKHQTTGES